MKTQDQKKLLVQFMKMSQTDEFNRMALQARKDLGLPAEGSTPTTNELQNLGDMFSLPETQPCKINSEQARYWDILFTAVHAILEPFPVDNNYFYLLVRHYIFFNKFYFDEILDSGKIIAIDSLCVVKDEMKKFLVMSIKEIMDQDIAETLLQMLKKESETYPVSIRIHPDATQRDIIDSVKKQWKQISSIQNSYYSDKQFSNRNSKTKINPKILKRNQYIFENRNLGAKQISKLLREKGDEPLDIGHINKIISLERARREMK